MDQTLSTLEISPALQAAVTLLRHIEVTEPPLVPEQVLDRLGFTMQSLPIFDLDRLTPRQRQNFGSVRGILSPVDRTIFVAHDLPPRRVPWLIYHETGHALIAWHRQLLYLDTEFTLSERVRTLMEQEANEFAGHLQFLGTQFTTDAAVLPFGATALLELAHRYEASIEATARRYAETARRPCACLVLQPSTTPNGIPSLKCHYFSKARQHAGYWDFGYRMGQILPVDDPIVRAFYDEGRIADGGMVDLDERDPKTGKIFRNQVFSNGLSAFVLAYPL